MGISQRRIAVCAHRKAQEIVDFISKHNGIPYVEEIIKIEEMPQEDIYKQIKYALDLKPNYYLFTTSEGSKRIFQISKNKGIFKSLLNSMLENTVVARGYKTRKTLLDEGFDSFHSIKDTNDFKNIVSDLEEKTVFIQMYGEDLVELENFITEKGGKVIKLWSYKYKPDIEKLDAFIYKLINGFYDVVIFTFAYQVKSLFERAKEIGLYRNLTHKLNSGVIVVSVGHITTEALYQNDVFKVIFPERERLYFALKEILKVFENG